MSPASFHTLVHSLLKHKSDHNHTLAQKPTMASHPTEKSRSQGDLRGVAQSLPLGWLTHALSIDHSFPSSLAYLAFLSSWCCPELPNARPFTRWSLPGDGHSSGASGLFFPITSFRSWLKWHLISDALADGPLEKNHGIASSLLARIHSLLLGTYHFLSFNYFFSSLLLRSKLCKTYVFTAIFLVLE